MTIAWDEGHFITGVSTIDAEHERIVGYLNELELAIARGDRVHTERVLEELLDYMRMHFAAEEALMEAARYSLIDVHKKKHEIFIRRASAFVARYMQGEEIAEQIHSLMVKWLPRHIAIEDRAIVGAIKAMIERNEALDHADSQNFFSKFVPRVFA